MTKMGEYKDPAARRRYKVEWDAANTRHIGIKLNARTDADIIQALEGLDSVQGYIKQLIREDIARREQPMED